MTAEPATSIPWPTPTELERLDSGFRERTLPKAEWTHLAHLAVGTWHVWRYGPDEALQRLRAGIRGLNDAHGTFNTDTDGYHETITRAYVCLIREFLSACPQKDGPADCVRALLASPLASKDVLFGYYSKEPLMSVAARRDWVEPDHRPFRLPV